MTEDQFWQLIERSREHVASTRRDGNMADQIASMTHLLRALPTADVRSYSRIFGDQFWRAYRWDLWAAAYIIGAGCSDDGFTDFRYWLISMGRDVFNRALADPESLVDVARAPGVEDVFFEEFGYVAATVLEERGEDAFEGEDLARADEPIGDKWDEDDLPRRFPTLWAAFGGST
jgi:hypothetical protein